MGFFSKTIGAIGGLFEEAGAAVGDVVEDIGTAVLGPTGTRGSRIGASVGGYFYGPEGAAAGARIGGALSEDVRAAPAIAKERRRAGQSDDQAITTPYQRPQITAVEDRPVTQQDYLNMQRGRQIYTAGLQEGGSVLDVRYPRDRRVEVIGTGMEFVSDIIDYFTDGDDGPAPQTMNGMMMCPTNRAYESRAFNVNRQTGCITITRKQQAKLKEAVRMFGGPQVAKNLGISNGMLQQLLLKTFRARRRGISGADIRAVKRVDRQMHSLACALGGISTTARATAARKSPPARKC